MPCQEKNLTKGMFMNKKIYLLLSSVIAISGVLIIAHKFMGNKSAMDKFATGGPISIEMEENTASTAQLPLMTCPSLTSITKKGLIWTSQDGKWENYTPSSASKIINFVGAQWLGIKVGKIICLYQTDEEVSFPLALEQTKAQLILEPKGYGWSSLIENYKLCKSANISDCPYSVEPPKDISNLYDEIGYTPSSE